MKLRLQKHLLRVLTLLLITFLLSSASAATKVREGVQTEGSLPTDQGGVPTGGTTGQVLAKGSNADFTHTWQSVLSLLTTGNLTDAGTDGIIITGGTGAVLGSGTSISQHVADGSHNGYLSSTDWTRFDAAVSAAGVSSWNGRTGAVDPEAGDYRDSDISFSDNTVNDSSTDSHGYFPKLSGDPTLFFNGAGEQVAVLGGQNQGSRIVNGGGVACAEPDCSTLDIIVSAADYIINGVSYHADQETLTLDAADPSDPRLDTIAFDDTGHPVAITGIAASNPIAPTVDPATQVFDTTVLVPAGGSGPGITTVDVYLENTEWTSSTNAGTINLASTNNPYAGSKDIEGTNTVKDNLFTLVNPGGQITPSNYTALILQIRSKALWPNAKAITVFWMNGATSVGTAATIKHGPGFDTSNTTTYQQIVIPMAAFNTGSSTADRLRFQVTGGASAIGWYIDNIILQSGGGVVTGGGDFSTNTNVSVVDEIVLFADTTGKLGKRSTGTGIASLTNGVLGTATQGNLTDVGTDGIVVTGGTNAVLGSGTSLAQHVADSTHNGYLSSTDWNTFNGKQDTIAPAALTKSDDTNVTLTLGGTPATALLQSVSLTLGWSGQLALSRGGTGANLSDPGANKLWGWDDTDNTIGFWSVGTGLSYDHSSHTLSATAQAQSHAVTFVVDGHGTVLTAATYAYVKIPYGGSLTGWTLIGSPSGSITVDIYRAADSAGLPVTSIVGGGGTKPALSTAVENSSTSFTGWTSTTLTAKDNLAIAISGVTSTTYAALILYYQ